MVRALRRGNAKSSIDLRRLWQKKGRFVMISLSLDESRETAKKFVRNKEIHWTQVFLGDWGQDRVTKDFEVGAIPSIWLLGPDGKIISRNLRDSSIIDE